MAANNFAVRLALRGGPAVELIDANGGGPGVRLRNRPRAKPSKR